MGFGFNLLFVTILIPATVILLLIWLFTKKILIGKILGFIWLGIISLAIITGIMRTVTSKMKLEKDDFYGQYTVDKAFYPGKQSDWQYNSFRFEIKNNDSIYFYVTNYEEVKHIYKGTITTLKPYSSERLVINMESPTHHILTTNPTIYRSTSNFYLVFNSPKFGNLFFSKGKWKRILK